MASEEPYLGQMPIFSLIEDVDACASRLFDNTASTLKDLQQAEQLKSDRGGRVDWTKLDQRERLLSSFLPRIREAQKDLSNMRGADFAALSLLWGNGDGMSP